jgi:hypothetical protein
MGEEGMSHPINDEWVLKFILGFKSKNFGCTPTYREIASGYQEHFGYLPSVSTISNSLKRLQKEEFITLTGKAGRIYVNT